MTKIFVSCNFENQNISMYAISAQSTKGDFFLAVVKAKGKVGKTSAFEVEAEGEAEGLVFCI